MAFLYHCTFLCLQCECLFCGVFSLLSFKKKKKMERQKEWQNNRCDIEYVKHHKKGAWGGGGLQSCLNRAPCMWFVYWCIAGAPLSLMGACRLRSIGLWHVTATSLSFKFKPYFREIMFWHDFGTIKDIACIFSFHSILSFCADV